ncbi:MAG: alkaline phosphatase D family protein [Acidiferrobacterales bacterium]|nr:alkaline phosphatase D family protein [Acidiferrobacterales bacterium]
MVDRRKFLKTSSLVFGGSISHSLLANQEITNSPALITPDSVRPRQLQGIQFGDVSDSSAIIWSRSDRPSRMRVEYSYNQDFSDSKTMLGPITSEDTDFTSRIYLHGLLENRDVFTRVRYQSLDDDKILSEALDGHFVTAPNQTDRDIHFLWSGDTAGQGWGINPEFGGMKIYKSMLNENPDFFIHCGDTVYADGPISEVVQAENNRTWRNVVTEEVSKVAESLGEFRGRYKYNLLDENVLAFNAKVPQIWQWDDHEVVNNWSDSKDLSDDDRYSVKDVGLLTQRGARSFLEYAPLKPVFQGSQQRVYRRIPYGKALDVLVLDKRSYRGANSKNNQAIESHETSFLGEQQLAWLKSSLKNSQSTWKIIASDMPIGLIVKDGPEYFENVANGDGMPLGRELELANLLRFIKQNQIKNVVWLTADVHYCAAHYYDPENAYFKDFSPFWEFVAGPMNAGSFGPGVLDNTFGPKVIFQKSPDQQNLSPFAGHQFYGDINIDKDNSELTVSLKDIDGSSVFTHTLQAENS